MESGMISVDRWSAGSQAYFLTHLHADHTSGLSAAWRRGPLFCSRLTAKLLPCKFPGFDLSLLRIAEIGSWHSLSLTSPSSGSPTDFVFKAIDAQHCPGAVMFLFRGDFGCMLYTGDFRWETSSKGMDNGRAVLLDALKNQTLNILHLDNTYCNPIFSFPSREVAAKQQFRIAFAMGAAVIFIWGLAGGSSSSDCTTVTALVSSCSSFVTNGSPDPMPGSPCCVAMTTLNNVAGSGDNRRSVCRCLMDLVTSNNPNATAIATLPGFCGVSLGFTIDPNTDCDYIDQYAKLGGR